MEKAEEKIKRLREGGVVLTLQRLGVLEALAERIHATAEEIYVELAKKYPTISRATIYSCLDALKQAGVTQELTIRKEMSYYDFDPRSHHHLLCRECGRILDMEISCPIAEKEEVKGHRVDEVQAYFYGVCRECRRGKKSKEKRRIVKGRKR
jgi:Fur family peroxide stress response transcriptional regulator